MNTIKVTVGNHLMKGVNEEFLCAQVDTSDKEEMDYCAQECVGAYIDMYSSFFDEGDFSQKVNNCWYVIEEVSAHV